METNEGKKKEWKRKKKPPTSTHFEICSTKIRRRSDEVGSTGKQNVHKKISFKEMIQKNLQPHTQREGEKNELFRKDSLPFFPLLRSFKWASRSSGRRTNSNQDRLRGEEDISLSFASLSLSCSFFFTIKCHLISIKKNVKRYPSKN